ncbi:glycolate oxidase subunit GlcE [Aurantiacibacter rhizosphaerae]|uniref:Glycolate oxidase subunit GlcE n=1 Tax=Aurantiacibacter rhizosphaerae TaxID=2691582 RepID=A0A844XFW2_9SPHN|nr:glycolate oxidase subunit GlcE [Aurantiacibacter rhizosphaerae]MWV28629.1 glycolate oxidase subunit GlcE [Aurantiacibacter rhizosphaerae]
MLRPDNTHDLAEIIGTAVQENRTLEIRGGGGKTDFGAPRACDDVIDMRGFSGVSQYDPAELVLTAGAGTQLSEIESLVAGENQMLAFEPWDYGLLWNRGGVATIGGTIAAGIAGSRRVSMGSARDHLLGFEAVSGRGERFIAGGNVVKNVTGFDLSKLVTGSWGRLVALTQVTLKVVPRPRLVASFALDGLSPAAAQRAMNVAMGSQAEIAAAAYLPGDPSQTVFRLEGIDPSIAARRQLVAEMHAELGMLRPLSEDEGAQFWERVQQFVALGEDQPLWRIHLPPSQGAAMAEKLDPAGEAQWHLDWAGALLWIATSLDADTIRDAAASAGGHATLVRADATMRSRVPALHPPASGVAKLESKVREAFDPMGVFASARFGGGKSARAD